MTEVLDFPSHRIDYERHDRPFLEASNEGGEWVLYIVSGNNGDYRKIATFVNYAAVDAFFSHRARGG